MATKRFLFKQDARLCRSELIKSMTVLTLVNKFSKMAIILLAVSIFASTAQANTPFSSLGRDPVLNQDDENPKFTKYFEGELTTSVDEMVDSQLLIEEAVDDCFKICHDKLNCERNCLNQIEERMYELSGVDNLS